MHSTACERNRRLGVAVVSVVIGAVVRLFDTPMAMVRAPAVPGKGQDEVGR